MTAALEVKGLHARLGDLHILRGVDVEVPYGEVHALMGPNGSGKSTLCHALMGKPGYETQGSALVDGNEVLGLPIDERARLGLFEAFQYPVEVPGVTLADLTAELIAAAGEDAAGTVDEAVALSGVDAFLDRYVNVGLSGGEKKRSELMQLLALGPRAAVLDEIDSGLDVDAVRNVAEIVEGMRGPRLGVLLITHYNRILKHLDVDRVHVMVKGKIVRSGDSSLAEELEEQGYDELLAEAG